MATTLVQTSREARDSEVEPRASRRVLHIVENLDRQAVENWLVRTLAHARKTGLAVDWTFYCVLGRPGALDEFAKSLDARVIHSPVRLSQKAAFVRALRGELRRGRYDVVHCHHDILSAVYLLASAGIPVRERIVHVHNADEVVPTPSQMKQKLFREPMRRICLMMADRIVGISNHTLDAFLAGRSRRPQHDFVHYYGVDSKPFEHLREDRWALRRELHLPDDALVLLFAGRLVPEKNPVFATDVLASLRRLVPSAVGVFAGSGSLESEVVRRARELGVHDSVRVLGWRKDIPELMSCSDWFILPHPEHPLEGFGLAVVEAQLAGLRLLISHGVKDDPLLPTASFRRLSLSDSPEAWAKAAVELLQESAPSRVAALAALKQSPMDIDHALNGLLSLYS